MKFEAGYRYYHNSFGVVQIISRLDENYIWVKPVVEKTNRVCTIHIPMRTHSRQLHEHSPSEEWNLFVQFFRATFPNEIGELQHIKEERYLKLKSTIGFAAHKSSDRMYRFVTAFKKIIKLHGKGKSNRNSSSGSRG